MKKVILALGVLFLFACNKTDYGKDISELKNQITILQGQFGLLQKTTDSLNNELKLTKTQIVMINTKIDSLFKRIDIVNTQLSLLTSDLNSKITLLASQTVTQQNETSKSILVLISQITTLQKELSDLTKQIALEKELHIKINGFEIMPVDSRLKSTNKGVITVPVVIVNYIPTSDGIYLDKNLTLGSTIPWDEAHKYLLSRAKNKILTDKIIEKNAIEESTKFRDYTTNTVKPYVDIDVVAYINVYDVKYIKTETRSVDTTDDNINNPVIIDWYRLDYKDIASRINLGNYVDNKGVKEVWLTTFPKEAGYLSFNVPESNMSPKNGATYYDVSNGGGDMNDLPRYNNTYVVYGDNGWRGVDTDLHNRGHQLESQMAFVDKDNIWWSKFAKVGRAGNTHWCPNSKEAYDYWNKTSAKSDIMTWKPSGGNYIDVNVDTWLGKTYKFESSINMSSPGPFATGTINYSNDAQVKWFIFWWQSVPGYNNGIIDGITKVNNWWDIFYNWDDAIKNNKKLVQ
jgi:hypothetical protein